MEETIRKFKDHLRKMNAYTHAFGVLNYDSETVMPKGSVRLRSLGHQPKTRLPICVTDAGITIVSTEERKKA